LALSNSCLSSDIRWQEFLAKPLKHFNMVATSKKTAPKKAARKTARKANPGTGKKQDRVPAGKGSRSQTDKQKKAGTGTGSKQLAGNSSRRTSPKKLTKKREKVQTGQP
jgi:hypothetical protein